MCKPDPLPRRPKTSSFQCDRFSFATIYDAKSATSAPEEHRMRELAPASRLFCGILAGAGRGSRTPKTRRSADFESAASASSAIPALGRPSHCTAGNANFEYATLTGSLSGRCDCRDFHAEGRALAGWLRLGWNLALRDDRAREKSSLPCRLAITSMLRPSTTRRS
jgi:hypothetical protein